MKKGSKITLYIAAPIVVAAAVLIYNHFSTNAVKTEPPVPNGGGREIPVNIYIVEYQRVSEGLSSLGTILPNEEVDIASEVAGKVDKISFSEGTRVKRGEVMVKVNDDDLQSQLKRATFQRKLLKEKLDRSRILLQKDAVSREAFDQIETDYNMIEADIELLEVRIDKTSIKAPFDGVVGFRYISPGSYIQPGTRIAHIVDYSSLKIEFSLPERYYRETLLGTGVTFSTESDDQPRQAKIYAINPTVDQQTLTIQLRAIYRLNTMKVIPGMFAKVIVGQSDNNTIMVPTQAVVPDVAQKRVWIVRQGKALMQQVTTGLRTETMIEVTQGLMPGDSVVTTGLLQIKQGAKLKINK